MELDKIIPTDGPNINEVEKYINKYQSEVIAVSYTHLTLPTIQPV